MAAVPADLADALQDRYRLERELGQGGMATVFLARDLKHPRPVAIKVLRPELAAVLGADRFLREIALTAQLQHPHILPLFDSGQAGSFLYYVMPFVEGESLRQRLERVGPLPLDEALRITRQVGEALDSAHRMGVIHRDLKPENILLHDGNALLADFGIALALSDAGGERLTETGISIGTPGYMSPEQATADRQLDARSDIYSLGAVLYEMLTGEPPFTGANAQAIIAKLITTPALPLRVLRPSVPVEVELAVRRALAKQPADRFGSVRHFLAALSATAHAGATESLAATAPSGRRSWGKLAAGLGAGAMILGLAWTALTARRAGPSAPAARPVQLTFEGTVLGSEISPDGQLLAMVTGKGPRGDLSVRDLKGGTVTRLAPVMTDLYWMRWSPDGTSLLFSGGDSSGAAVVLVFPRLGGAPRRLFPHAGFPAWSPDGSQVALWPAPSAYPIKLMDVATGALDSLAGTDSTWWLDAGDWSPSGKFLVIPQTPTSGAPRGDLALVGLDRSGWRQLVSDTPGVWAPRWSATGDGVYYMAGRDLRWIGVRPDGRAAGGPQTVALLTDAADVSLTRDGHRLVYTRAIVSANIWLVDLTPAGGGWKSATTQLTQGTAMRSIPRLSPDGQEVAYTEQRGTAELYVVPRDGRGARQVTFSGDFEVSGYIGSPAWSPDGKSLVYCGRAAGVLELRIVNLADGRARTLEGVRPGESCQLAWAPGHDILYQKAGNRSFGRLDPTTGSETPVTDPNPLAWTFVPSYSPDGRRVALGRNGGDRDSPSAVVLDISTGAPPIMLGSHEQFPIGWSPDSRLLYTKSLEQPEVMAFPATGGQGRLLAKLPFPTSNCTSAVQTGTRLSLVCRVVERSGDAWMIEGLGTGRR